MDPFLGKAATFLSLLTYVFIRWPHGRRIKRLAINEDRQRGLEIATLTGAWFGTTVIPMIWVMSGFPSYSDYPLQPAAFAIGLVVAAVGHWLFYRSHADLGLYWSPALQMRDNHALITTGIYSRIRHPMYTAMMLQGIGQVLFLPNWIVGPTWLVSFGILYLCRVGHEERMMIDRFGDDYEAYMERTGRLWPRRQP